MKYTKYERRDLPDISSQPVSARFGGENASIILKPALDSPKLAKTTHKKGEITSRNKNLSPLIKTDKIYTANNTTNLIRPMDKLQSNKGR
jgi:hypothetical protein